MSAVGTVSAVGAVSAVGTVSAVGAVSANSVGSARGSPPSARSPPPSLYVHPLHLSDPLLMFHSFVSLWLAEFCQNACAIKIRFDPQVWYSKYLDGSCNASKAGFSLPFIVSAHFGFHDTLI